MPQATVRIHVENVKAFVVAIEALRAIAALDADGGDPEDWERCYGAGAELAQEALQEIAEMGITT